MTFIIKVSGSWATFFLSFDIGYMNSEYTCEIYSRATILF